MPLQLQRPICIFDLETTGVNISKDRIVEIAIVKLMPDGTKQTKTKLVNPEMPIPKEVSEIHGIRDEDVKDAPTFKQLANELKQFFDNSDIAGFNSNKFDIPMLVEEFLRTEIDFNFENRKLVDVQKIFHMMEPRNLGAALQFYCNETLINAHSAEADAEATLKVLQAQIDKYDNLTGDVSLLSKVTGDMEDLIDFSRRFIKVKGIATFNFGKHKGKPVNDVFRTEPSYYDWMMQGDFSLHTKQKLSEMFTAYKFNK
jgi:DNA polymerase-3 subunit epsilon